ncbi:MAG: phosphoribosylanthranilate isomerase [Thermodesulfovibrionales bacterium]
MKVKVKICGITNLEDGLKAVEYGADALGFVFFKKSPRYIEPEKAAEIIRKIPPFVSAVGVFVNTPSEEILRIALFTGINTIQLHGDESPESIIYPQKTIKSIRVRELSDLEPLKDYPMVHAFLLDTYSPEDFGGTGMAFNWDIAGEAKKLGRIILAGGLNPDNIERAIRWVHPYGVDVSSGVEKEKGIKDHKKLKAFIEIVKSF